MIEQNNAADYSLLTLDEQEKILHLQQAILESIALGADHKEVINSICKLEEKLLPNSVGSVMLMDDNYELLNVYAAPSVPPEGVLQLNGLRPGPGGGSCGNVIYQKKAQFVSNTFTDERWSDLRQLAYNFNLCSCWSVPVYSGNDIIIGTFALSSFEHRSPSPFHRKLLDIGSSIIGIVLERSKSEASLRLFERVFDGGEEGIMITDPDKNILSVNHAFTRILGYSMDELKGETPRKLASGYHDDTFYSAMWDSINKLGYWRGEIWNRRKDGEIFPEWLSISSVTNRYGDTTHYLGIFSDLSHIKEAEQQIQYLSSHDILTGLPNLILFKDRLQNAINFAQQNHQKVALLNLDLDNFKLINETLGHTQADSLLCTIADRLRTCVNETDALCRQGGDEFIIALTNITAPEAISNVLDHLLEQMAQPFQIGERIFGLSCSIGIAVFPDDDDNIERLMTCSEKAMLQAKQEGRNTYRYFTEQLNTNSFEFLKIAHGIKDALAAKQFLLYYQPQVELSTGRVIGAEALIRWNHPKQGLIPPHQFINIAEETGLIVEIGEWVLQEACRQAVAWQQQGLEPIVIAVNVSAVQFRRGNIENVIEHALLQSGLAPRFLEIEITESCMLHDIEQMQTLLLRLKNKGLSLSIDDFGTGYSSLAYLKKLNIDKLKIDQSFVRDITTDPNDEAIIKAIVQMAHTLKLKVIAEGVEDQATLNHLNECQCDEIQGYYFAKPLPAQAFADYLKANQQSQNIL
jgi:diguanylate cyclase (GGDEF)-like protein/PAS domain S-box-containing protein